MKQLLLVAYFTVTLFRKGEGVNCYQCMMSSKGSCKDSVCNVGLFGCFKTITYIGGKEHSGLQNEGEQYQLQTTKGCSLLPIGAQNTCVDQTIFGTTRQVTCYCSTEYCNRAPSPRNISIVILFFILFSSQFE